MATINKSIHRALASLKLPNTVPALISSAFYFATLYTAPSA
jgi:hypothetical protein